jgi:sugar lactone lactonase YvrE
VDGAGSAARFSSPAAITLAVNGDLFIADTANHQIRRITPEGIVSTVAGQAGVAGYADGAADAALFKSPGALASDDKGTLYIADSLNRVVRKISTGGVVSTIAGAVGVIGSADGIGSAARFNNLQGIAVDGARNIYVTDLNYNLLRKISASDGRVTTLAGKAGLAPRADGTGADARFFRAGGVIVARDGSLRVAELGHAVRKVTPEGVVTTLAANPPAQQSGALDAAGTAARFNSPQSLTLDRDGNIYIADTGNFTIRKLATDGAVTTVAGTAGLAGTVDATGPDARFGSPVAVAMSPAGILHVADWEIVDEQTPREDLIRRVGADGAVTTLAGMPGSLPETETLMWLSALAFDSLGNLYAADTNAIHKITPAGDVSYFMGGSRWSVTQPDGSRLWIQNITPKDGPWGKAIIPHSKGITIDDRGYFFLTQDYSYSVRRMIPYGDTSTVAGVLNEPRNSAGSNDGTGTTARFNSPRGIVVDSVRNLYLADSNNHTIRRISRDGLVTTIGGIPGYAGAADAVGDRALFNQPTGMAIDAAGNLYVTDTKNHRIVKGTPLPAPEIVIERPDGSHLASDGTQIAFAAASPGSVRYSTETFKLWNVGTTTLDITALEISGEHAADFRTEPTSAPFAIEPGEARTLELRFQPAGLGPRAANLRISSNDADEGTFTIALVGSGQFLPEFSGYAFSTRAGVPVEIPLVKLLAAASHPAGDPLTMTPAAGSTAAGGNIELLATTIRYTPPPLPFVGDDHFAVTFADAHGGSVTGSVSVTVATADAIAQAGMAGNPPQLTWLPDGRLEIGFHGIPGRSYQIQRSLDLAGWQTIATLTAGPTGSIIHTDPVPPRPNAYYRLAAP